MKKIICLFSITIIIFISIVNAFAHQGGTDSKGGHYNRDTGEYHYHHGYSAHQHTNGECPYDFKDNTTEQKNSIHSSNNEDLSLSLFVKTSPFYNWGVIDVIHLLCTFIVVVLLLWLFRKDFKCKEIESITVFFIDLFLLVAFSLSLDFAGASGETFINTCVCGFIGLTLGNIFAIILLFKISPYLIEFVEFVFYKVKTFNCRWKSIQNDRSDKQ